MALGAESVMSLTEFVDTQLAEGLDGAVRPPGPLGNDPSASPRKRLVTRSGRAGRPCRTASFSRQGCRGLDGIVRVGRALTTGVPAYASRHTPAARPGRR